MSFTLMGTSVTEGFQAQGASILGSSPFPIFVIHPTQRLGIYLHTVASSAPPHFLQIRTLGKIPSTALEIILPRHKTYEIKT